MKRMVQAIHEADMISDPDLGDFERTRVIFSLNGTIDLATIVLKSVYREIPGSG